MFSRHSVLAPLMLLLALLLSSPLAFASPVKRDFSMSKRIAQELGLPSGSLSARDVVVPRITSPTASSVWPIGSTQFVTWDTSDFPPDDQITNPLGRVLLGFDSGDSLNLDIDNPLAEGFSIRDGRVSIVVPDVPPRDDYLIVLMGNSGNTSPSFAITRISGGGSTTGSSPAPTTSRVPTSTTTPAPGIAPTTTATTTSQPAVLSSTTITDPIPITGSTITGGDPNATQIPTFSDTLEPSTTGTASQANQTSAVMAF
ncbi:hypothetical protein MD484_g7794, partial [Candolleomyces efflorescens]